MWIVFETLTIGEMKTISVGLDSKEDAISFRKTMLEGTNYKGANLTFAYVGELDDLNKKLEEVEVSKNKEIARLNTLVAKQHADIIGLNQELDPYGDY